MSQSISTRPFSRSDGGDDASKSTSMGRTRGRWEGHDNFSALYAGEDRPLQSRRYVWLSRERRARWHRQRLPWLLTFLLLFFALFSCLRALSKSLFSKAPLALAQDNTFQIAVFADLHYGENESTFGIPADKHSTALMRQILSLEDPNFVVLNGDLITGENTFAFNSTNYVDEVVAPLVQGGYRWASTYGNHDSKYNLSREALFAQEEKHANCYTEHGPTGSDGVTNYVLPVFPFDLGGSIQKPVALLWFFDSRGGAEYQHLPENVDNIPNYVSNETVSWYRTAQADLQRKYGTLPSIAFVHIPFQAFLQLQDQSSPNVSGPRFPV